MPPFLDTNVLFYAASNDVRRTQTAKDILSAGGLVSVQILNEFVAVAMRKLRRTWPEVAEMLQVIRLLCKPPLALTQQTHERAVALGLRYGYAIYDATVLASALEAGCDTLITEDMQDGQMIEGQLTIRNPFRLI